MTSKYVKSTALYNKWIKHTFIHEKMLRSQAHSSSHFFEWINMCLDPQQSWTKLWKLSMKKRRYTNFCEWRKQKNAKGVDERIILAYISGWSKHVESVSQWSYYSQLKKMLSVKENIDISMFLTSQWLFMKLKISEDVEFVNWWPCQSVMLKTRVAYL